MSQTPAITPTVNDGEPGGNSGRKEYLPSSSHQTAATPYRVPWGNSGCEITGYWPQTAKVHIKRMISMNPESCIFPNIEKPLNSLTRDIWFSEINSGNILMFQLPGLCYKHPHISWLLPYLFGALPQGYLRGCLPALSPQKVCQIKHNSKLLGSAFFFSVNRK